MKQVNYQPSLFSDEIPREQLEKLPKFWTEYYNNYAIRHLLLWRRHLEGDYQAKSKNFNITMTKMDDLGKKGHQISDQIHRQLIEDNAKALDAHDRLRDLENKINQQINEINKESRVDRERFTSKVLSALAIIISAASLYYSHLKKENISVADVRGFEGAVRLEYLEKIRPEILAAIENESKVRRQDLEEIRNRLSKIEKRRHVTFEPAK